jgi:hypothetical protein
VRGCGLDPARSWWDLVAGLCRSGFYERREFLEQLSDYNCFKKTPAHVVVPCTHVSFWTEVGTMYISPRSFFFVIRNLFWALSISDLVFQYLFVYSACVFLKDPRQWFWIFSWIFEWKRNMTWNRILTETVYIFPLKISTWYSKKVVLRLRNTKVLFFFVSMHLFMICFKDAVSSTDYIALNGRISSE